MHTMEAFKFHQAGTQEVIVFKAPAMAHKHRVTSKQERGGLICVCVRVWITLLIQLIPAEEEPIQLQRGDHF